MDLPSIDTISGLSFSAEKERIETSIKEATTNVSKYSSEAATNMTKAAEDTAASAIQMATLAQKKLDVAIKALLSSKLLDPTAGQEN